MKKTLFFKKLVLFMMIFCFQFALIAQSQKNYQLNNSADRSKNVISTSKKVLGTNRATNTPASKLGGGSTTVVTACDSYTWSANGVTYNSSGLYTTGGGVTQGYNNQTDWSNSITSSNASTNGNNLGGLPTGVNPTNVLVGTTTASFSAVNGMYSNGTFLSTNTATDVLTINFSTPIYGFSANIFATNISDAVVTGDITVTYSTSFVDARTVILANEFFGYTSTTPITSVTITCANTISPFKWPTINNLTIATNPQPSVLDLTIENGPVTTPYSVCQGGTVVGGLTSTLGGTAIPLPNYSGDTTGGPTFNRSVSIPQGGTCTNSGVGTAVRYATHSFTAPLSGSYTFSTCTGPGWDNFLSLYQNPFNPAGLCAGNVLIIASDDFCGAQAEVTVNLVAGTLYTLVLSGFGNADFGTYNIVSTTPNAPGVEWYTSNSGGSAIANGSPFNPVGVTGSGITDTNTVGVTQFYAQFPGDTCRSLTLFEVIAPTTPTFNAVSPICNGDVIAALPTTSNNGITGTWSPTLNNTATTIYTFTPDSGQCATNTTLEIIVNTTAAPTVFTGINVTMTDGCAIYNGIYNDNGILNGKKTFVYSLNSSFNISFDGLKWVLWCCGGIGNTGFENTTVPAGLYPPTTGWTSTQCISGTLTIDLPNTSFCDGATVADLTATGTNLQWYDVATGGTALASSTVLVTGSYYVSQTLNGCESITTQLDVTINPLSSNTTTVSACDTYTWAVNGTTYTTSGMYTSVTGCDTQTLNLTITPSTTTNTVASACDTYTWAVNGTTYTTSGMYNSVIGCDTQTLDLTITPSTSTNTVTSACDSYTWSVNGTTYTTSGMYSYVTGCDTQTLNLTITPTPTVDAGPTPPTSCDGTNVTLTGTVSTTLVNGFSGAYDISNWSLINTNTNGSINTGSAPISIALTGGNNGSGSVGNTDYIITATTTTAVSFNWSYSTGDGANWDRPNFLINGTPTLLTGYNTGGATTQSGTMTVNVTAGQTFGFNMRTLDNTFGAATVVISNFSANANPTLQWVASNGGTIVGANNQLSVTATTAGTYTLTATDGTCLSSDFVDVTYYPVTPTPTGTATQSFCDSATVASLVAVGNTIQWYDAVTAGNLLISNDILVSGNTYYASQTLNGCESARLAVSVTIIPSTTSNTVASVCDTYTWSVNGTTYTTSGMYTSVTGCDTQTLDLTITPSTTNNTVASACDSYIWSVNGTTYTTSGMYTSITGCDTQTLDLTIIQSTTTNTVASACDTYTWSVNGATYTTSGMYTSVAGCDTQTLDLTITSPTTPTFTQVAPICSNTTLATLPTTSNNGITGTWTPALNNTATTTYTFTPDAGQCTITTTMTIVVNPNPVVTFSANPFPICAGNSTVLTAITNNITPTVNFVDGSSVNQSLNMIAATFGTPITSPLSGMLVLAPSNGCAAFAPGLFAGKIALIQRGTCSFAIKAQNAQAAGAIGVLLYNNVAGNLNPGGTSTATIPVYGITQANGLALIAAMTGNEVPVTLSPSPVLSYVWSNGSVTQTTNTGVLNVDTDFSVTVTNTATGCSTLQTVTVPVTPNTIPTFTQVDPICNGGTLSPLPTTSNNGIAGTWSPAVDNTATTTYTFTSSPVAGQCLGTTTMTIIVNPVTSNTTIVSACDSYTWSVNGTTYTTSGMYTSVAGCDTQTLDLTVTISTTNNTVASACDSYTWSVNGTTYTTSGMYTSVTGCGTQTLDLTISTASIPTGNATQTLVENSTVVDIVVSPTNIIWYPSEADALAGTNALPNTTVLTDNTTYYAVNLVGSCSSLPFAVTVTITLRNEGFDNVNFSYYPNPTYGILNIKYSKEISEVSVINLLGQLIISKKTNDSEVQIDLSSLPQETYLVRVLSEGLEKTFKVIKK